MDNKQVTVYKNELNTSSFRKFNTVEMNLFFAICSKMREKGLSKIQFDFIELKELIGYTDRNNKRFISQLDSLYTKMLTLTYRKGNSIDYSKFVLFTGFNMKGSENYIEISVNPELEYLINEISTEFTKFELEEFTSLKSSYSKTMFRLLKQFRLTGYYKVNIDEFRRLLDIPTSYPMYKIDQSVLSYIKKELPSIFKNLKIKKIKAKKQNKIEYLEFSFTPQDDIRKDGSKIFKDNVGNYYENDIEHFTKEEVNKSFPTS